MIKLDSALHNIPAPGLLNLGDMIGYAPEHFFDGLNWLTVITTAQALEAT